MMPTNHIYETGYKLGALLTLFKIQQERKEQAFLIRYKKEYEHLGEKKYFDLENTSEYEKEIKQYINSPILGEGIKYTLATQLQYALNICSIWDNELSNIKATDNDRIFIYFTFKEDSMYPFNNILYTKRNIETGEPLFINMSDYTSSWQTNNLDRITLYDYIASPIASFRDSDYTLNFNKKECTEKFLFSLYSYSRRIADILINKVDGIDTLMQYKLTKPKDLFDTVLILQIHKEFNQELWFNISQRDFLDTINNPTRNIGKIRLRKDMKNKIYYLIDCLRKELEKSKIIEKAEIDNWLKGILLSLDLTRGSFNSKYRAVIGQDKSNNDIPFSEKVEEIFSIYHKE